MSSKAFFINISLFPLSLSVVLSFSLESWGCFHGMWALQRVGFHLLGFGRFSLREMVKIPIFPGIWGRDGRVGWDHWVFPRDLGIPALFLHPCWDLGMLMEAQPECPIPKGRNGMRFRENRGRSLSR